MKKTIYLLAFALVLLTSCDSQRECCTVVETSLSMKISNGQGLDLLDQNSPTPIEEQQIKAYKIVEGTQEFVKDSYKLFHIYQVESEDFYRLSFLGSGFDTGNFEYLIELNQASSFRIELHSKVNSTGNIYYLDEVYYQGELMYKQSSGAEPFIELVLD
ncbi:MAG: hypothetical protein ACPGRE_06470 [Flavobacteriaceae bacterium]